jgi:hypothetical protein
MFAFCCERVAVFKEARGRFLTTFDLKESVIFTKVGGGGIKLEKPFNFEPFESQFLVENPFVWSLIFAFELILFSSQLPTVFSILTGHLEMEIGLCTPISFDFFDE